jgi:hypothetical protein
MYMLLYEGGKGKAIFRHGENQFKKRHERLARKFGASPPRINGITMAPQRHLVGNSKLAAFPISPREASFATLGFPDDEDGRDEEPPKPEPCCCG